MKASNLIKLSMLTLKTSKKTNIFMIILITIISLFLNVFIFLGTSLKYSQTMTNEGIYLSDDVNITFFSDSKISNDMLKQIHEEVHKNNIEIKEISSYLYGSMIYDFNYFTNDSIINVGKNYIYLPMSYNTSYKINDTYINDLGEFIIADFLDINYKVVDLNYLVTNNYLIQRLSIRIDNNKTVVSKALAFYKNLKKMDAKISCDVLDTINKASLLFNVILSFILLFSIAILVFLLYIISNSIVLLYQKNNYTNAMLLALGCLKKDNFLVSLLNYFVLGITGIAIGFFATYCSFSLFNGFGNNVLKNIYDIAFDGEFSTSFWTYKPIYLLFIEIILSLAVVYVFLRRKNKNISYLHLLRGDENDN